jgi:3-hydroxyanthranilate 3,4-dioxygenase
MSRFAPLNFKKWIEDHRHLLKPPVGNAQIWADREFMVTVVGGPNARSDFHVDEGEEFFYQLEGDITLRVRDEGKTVDLPIREGEIFLLPPRVPHSPIRPANTVGLVIGRRRREGELDGFQWFCEQCDEKLYEEFFPLKDLVKDLPPVFERYWSNPANHTCSKCGWVAQKPASSRG